VAKYPRLTFLKVVAQHKWFVFVVGRNLGVSLWRLLIHDWSKLTPAEFNAYAQFFYGDRESVDFERCWVHHQNCNPHHPEYWVNRSEESGKSIPMPEWAVKEMVADWVGASRAYGGVWPQYAAWEWFQKSFDAKPLHSDTRRRVLELVQLLADVQASEA